MKPIAPFVVMITGLIVSGIVLVNWFNFRLKQHLLHSNPFDDRLVRFMGSIWHPAREALKWGLILLGAGIGLVIISLMPEGDKYLPLNTGIEVISIAAGFLAYYRITYKKTTHEK